MEVFSAPQECLRSRQWHSTGHRSRRTSRLRVQLQHIHDRLVELTVVFFLPQITDDAEQFRREEAVDHG